MELAKLIPESSRRFSILGLMGAGMLLIVTFGWLNTAFGGKVSEIYVGGSWIDAYPYMYGIQCIISLIALPLLIVGCIGLWAGKEWKYAHPSVVGFGSSIVANASWLFIYFRDGWNSSSGVSLVEFGEFVTMWDFAVITLISGFILLGLTYVFAKTEVDRDYKDAGLFVFISAIIPLAVYLVRLFGLLPALSGMDGLAWSFGVASLPSLFVLILMTRNYLKSPV